jgi:hypothetical protein
LGLRVSVCRDRFNVCGVMRRIMQENVALIKEINALRKEIKNMRQGQRSKDMHIIEYNKEYAATLSFQRPALLHM